MNRIPVAGPWITEKEIRYVTEAVSSCWYGRANEYHERFEKAFASHIGRTYAIALPSCTSAIHLALLALGVGEGDEVIVPDITWIASVAPVSYVGATPIFCDIDTQNWGIDPQALEEAISERTKAIIVVDLYGNMPEYGVIEEIAERHGIPIIEDSAQAIGSEYRGIKAGKFGEISVFSFHGSKTLTTGEGGMLLTDNEAIYRRCLILRDHGREPKSGLFWNLEVAYKYKMSSMQAALGLAQLERIDELVERKREIFSWYQNELGSSRRLVLNHEQKWVKNSYWMVTVIVSGSRRIEKEKIIQKLSERSIDSRPFFYRLSTMPAYRGRFAAVTSPNADRIAPFGVNLPSALNLSEEQVNYVSQSLLSLLGPD